ncbi:sugar phosphate isomerase/epimerase [Streptomyces sp. NBS 14/10]|uniref:sugar phosphate isomerase/epimerase family protein n=1 Tax=Streptomyces sp. NBS 14/10 TaxID=1945643 RepID=UPI000B7DC5E2|nr:sugar phosphate isomerase/epimerase [Streptomyces sp. NBS 14/10]KAK1184368.1 sugar phosphate isomerase/epimerase [Streptomyces sp. NBS 14/10]
MTELGVFARVFPSGPPHRVATAIRAAGFTATQLNLSAVGRPTLDATLTPQDAAAIAAAFTEADVRIWGLSGTFNAIDPDEAARRKAIDACLAVIRRAPDISAEVVTICTGTRDPHNMWRAHPDNTSPQAWADLRGTLDALLPAAAAAGVRLGIEPEPGNVIRDADAAAVLLHELGDDARHLAVVLDPANLLTVDTAKDQERILSHAFAVLGDHTAAVHAKDVVASGYASPGTGALDYDLVMRLHAALPQPVPVIAQDLVPEDAPRVYAFLHAYAYKYGKRP